VDSEGTYDKEKYIEGKVREKLLAAGCDESLTGFIINKYSVKDIEWVLAIVDKKKIAKPGAYIRKCLESCIEKSALPLANIDEVYEQLNWALKNGWVEIKMGLRTGGNIFYRKRKEADSIEMVYKNKAADKPEK